MDFKIAEYNCTDVAGGVFCAAMCRKWFSSVGHQTLAATSIKCLMEYTYEC